MSNFAVNIFKLAETIGSSTTYRREADAETAITALKELSETPWRTTMPGGEKTIEWGEAYFATLQARIRGSVGRTEDKDTAREATGETPEQCPAEADLNAQAVSVEPKSGEPGTPEKTLRRNPRQVRRKAAEQAGGS